MGENGFNFIISSIVVVFSKLCTNFKLSNNLAQGALARSSKSKGRKTSTLSP